MRWPAAALALALALPGVARGDDEIDACALVPLSEVAPLVVQDGGFEVRARSEHPEPGESICRWEAFQKGQTAGASPTHAVVAALYHFANAKRAASEFNRAWQGMVAPSLVRTEEPTDHVAREDDGGIAVVHGTDLVTLDPSGQEYALKRQPDRFYQLEALAFRIAGAKVQGAVDPNAIQSPCAWLPEQHALGVLTTDPSSLRLSYDGPRCGMAVQDGMPDLVRRAQNHGVVQIERRDMGTNAAALRFQHQQTPFLPASTLVKTADASDRLVWDSEHPEDAWAVHGPFYVEFHLTDATPAAKAVPGWLYRTQRLAFEAAGATIVATDDLPPEPVVPPPLPARPSRAEADAHWMPPPRDAPAGAELFDPALAVLAFAARNRFFVLVGVFFASFLAAIFLPGKRRKVRRTGWAGFAVVLAVVNLIFGTDIADRLIYHAGVAGSGVVTASRATASQYNSRTVFAYTVLIRAADGNVVETEFESWDFNVYPHQNLTTYPGRGDVFTVRYLKHAPQTFVIVADDDSPWARGLRCGALNRSVGDAAAKANFAPDNASYKDAYVQAVTAAQQAGCR